MKKKDVAINFRREKFEKNYRRVENNFKYRKNVWHLR